MKNFPEVKSPVYLVETIDELNGKNIKYRAMNVGEHKAFLTAFEMKDPASIIQTVIAVISACTFNKLDVEKQPAHVVDALFMLIYIKSVGRFIDVSYTCNHITRKPSSVENLYIEEACGYKSNVKLNLEDARIQKPDDYESRKIIFVNEEKTAGIKLREPTLVDIKKMDFEQNILSIAEKYIFVCVESIFDESGNVTTPNVDFSEEDFKSWIDTMDGSIIELMAKFFQALPVLALKLNLTCPACGEKEEISLSGLEDFFV